MYLAPRTETLVPSEDHSWLRSKHGTDASDNIKIDGAAFGAIYTDGFVKSGTLVALNTSTSRYVPYDQATSANGLNVPAGVLYTTIDIRNGSGGFVDSPAAILRHCKIIKSKLPRSTAQTGGAHADAVTALTGRIIFL
jgi:hypothetical protein